METARRRVPSDEPEDIRLDRYIAERMGLFSRSQVRNRVVEVLINGRPAKLNRKVRAGDEVEVRFTAPPDLRVDPEAIDLDIIYEDGNVTVVNKPQGMVVHPAMGNMSGTLVNALLHRYRTLQEEFPGQPARPGIVHRLDKDTSGVIVVARNTRAQEMIAAQFRDRRAKKLYVAIVSGAPKQSEGIVDTHITRDPRERKRFTWSESAGKRAVTRYRVARRYAGYAVVLFRPRTGRTHQIRVHARYLGCPVLGDPVYGRRDRRFPDATLMLHAYRLAIRIPQDEQGGRGGAGARGGELRLFKAPLPERMRNVMRTFSNGAGGADGEGGAGI